MPVLNIQRVVSCSSEDPKYPAANLLSADKKKWKCRNAGEKQTCVILQLAQQAVISSIDIGNEYSAFVEVLVGNSSAPDDDFEVLLVMSSFMSPMESRDGTNASRVRMFSQDMLLKPAAERKWDRVKIVCTQPFNKHVQYGLAFVVFHCLGSERPSLGRFALRDEEVEEDKITVGSLFARRKEATVTQHVTGPAAIRAATSLPPKPLNTGVVLTPKEKRSDAGMSPGADVVAARRNKVAMDDADDDKVAARKNGGIERKPSASTMSEKNKKRPAEEQQHQEKKKQRKPGKPFHELMKDVVLVISGYQNPTRGEIRSKALEMGAKYKGDWDNTSTHLVCAFPNTPKFQQVAGKGKIVRKEWIEDCHSQRKRIPWRRYAMDKKEQGKPESEDEIMEEQVETSKQEDNDAVAADSGSDTDDDIQRLQAEDPYGEDTDVDSEVETTPRSSVLPPLPSIFQHKVFHIHDSIEPEDHKRLTRYIVAFKGTITPKMDGEVKFVLAVGNTSDIAKMKARYPDVVVVHPDWVWACNDTGSLAPLDTYKI